MANIKVGTKLVPSRRMLLNWGILESNIVFEVSKINDEGKTVISSLDGRYSIVATTFDWSQFYYPQSENSRQGNISNLSDLNYCFSEAVEKGCKYIGVAIQIKGMEGVEIIINSHKNFDYKLKYYNQSYDNSLEHKHAEGIKIVGCKAGNSYEEIENGLGGNLR